MSHENTSRFKQSAFRRDFRKNWAESHSGRWDKNRAKEWMWIEESPKITKAVQPVATKPKVSKRYSSSRNLGA